MLCPTVHLILLRSVSFIIIRCAECYSETLITGTPSVLGFSPVVSLITSPSPCLPPFFLSSYEMDIEPPKPILQFSYLSQRLIFQSSSSILLKFLLITSSFSI